MAIQKNIKINVDTGQAVKDVDKLDDSFKNLDNQTEKTSAGLKDVGENGGAIAILDSLTGGLATRVRDAYEATKLFNFSLKGTRTALIATGVGAFIVALGVIVAYWDEIADAIKGTTENLETQLTLTKSIQSNLDVQLKTLDKRIELGKKQGLVNEELEAQRIAIIKRLQEQNDAEVRILENQLTRLKSTATEVGFWDSISGSIQFALFGAEGLATSGAKLAAERLTAIKDLETQIDSAKLAAIDLQVTLFDLENPEVEGGEVFKKRTPESIDNGLKSEDLVTLNSKEILAQKTDELDDKLTQSILDREKSALNEKRANALREIQYRQQVKEASIQLASSTLNALGALAEEGSALSKGVAVAQAIMSTYQGVNAALAQTTDPTPTQSLRFANAAAVGIAGLLNVKKILETQPISKGAPNISGGRGSAPAAPSFNLVEGTQENQIANSLNNREPVQSFVVATAVTSSQELNRNAESNGSL